RFPLCHWENGLYRPPLDYSILGHLLNRYIHTPRFRSFDRAHNLSILALHRSRLLKSSDRQGPTNSSALFSFPPLSRRSDGRLKGLIPDRNGPFYSNDPTSTN